MKRTRPAHVYWWRGRRAAIRWLHSRQRRKSVLHYQQWRHRCLRHRVRDQAIALHFAFWCPDRREGTTSKCLLLNLLAYRAERRFCHWEIRLWYNDYDRKDLKMRKMAAGSFKIHCLAVMDEVQAKRETVVITKHGKPVAKLVPADKNTDDIYNFLVGKGAIAGDIVSPAISDKEWGELK